MAPLYSLILKMGLDSCGTLHTRIATRLLSVWLTILNLSLGRYFIFHTLAFHSHLFSHHISLSLSISSLNI
jgi:hypothetical protein